MVLVIDNYDSFTYNLVQYIGEVSCENEEIKVIRNDKIAVKKIEKLSPERIVISPGPGRPKDAGISIDVIKHFMDKIPILGVCLGHQCIAAAFGGRIVRAEKILHGKVSQIYIKKDAPIFSNISDSFKATRYHSLLIKPDSFPEELKILAETDKNEIMAIKHQDFPLYGLQFHPESILTEAGKKILKNFIEVGEFS